MFKLWSGQDKAAKSEKSSNGRGVPQAESEPPSDDAPSSDSLAKVMRALGRHAFDLDQQNAEDVENEFERWARHVLVGAPLADDDDEASTDGRRDWGGLNRFVNTHRQKEKKYVTESLGDLRDVVLTFTQTIGHAVIEDQESDRQMVRHVEGLETASRSSSAEDMKQALISAAQGLSALLEDRKAKQAVRVQTLGEKLQQVQEELGHARKQMALDPLTQLYNRAALDTQLERVVGLSVLSGTVSTLFMIDIDHFKQVNDTYGHRAGDAVLRQLSDRLVSTFLRKADFLARYGGEELAVVLQGAGLDVATRIGERLLDTVRSKPFEHEGTEIPITISVGIAELISGEVEASWLERADKALYRAKESGRDRLCLADAPNERHRATGP